VTGAHLLFRDPSVAKLGDDVNGTQCQTSTNGTHRLTSTRIAIKRIPKSLSVSLTREIHHHRQLHHSHVLQPDAHPVGTHSSHPTVLSSKHTPINTIASPLSPPPVTVSSPTTTTPPTTSSIPSTTVSRTTSPFPTGSTAPAVPFIPATTRTGRPFLCGTALPVIWNGTIDLSSHDSQWQSCHHHGFNSYNSVWPYSRVCYSLLPRPSLLFTPGFQTRRHHLPKINSIIGAACFNRGTSYASPLAT
jgi:hypothetical protein